MVRKDISLALCGLAGRFPESNGLHEFSDNLYHGFDMVSDSRRGWSSEMYKIPRRMGQLKDLDKFDADCFSIHGKQAENMDPRLRILLEVSHECITDAGINPVELTGLNIGVYVGASGEEAAEGFKRSSGNPSGYILTGGLLSALANRLSFTFNLRGPSISMDTACSSSLLALEQAGSAIRCGKVESALVAGVNLLLDPKTTLLFTNLAMTAPDGKCKSFDSMADGYVRSEAAVAAYICKGEFAKRCYANIIHAGTNTDGYKANGITYPSGAIQEDLLRKVYAEAGVDPSHVGYVEAHGTGTQAGDFEEINAITRVFCNDRDPCFPLLIGSLKSNMGHSEPASGLCGIAKLVLIAQTRIIPRNLHFSNPNPKIPALMDGRIKVVSSNTAFEGGIVGINSFGFGGTNVHAILKLPTTDEMTSVWAPTIPIIMPLSGRTTEVASSLDKLTKAENKMVASLLHNIGRRDIPGHGFRSYAIVDGSNTVVINTNQERIKKEHRSLWFIFSGTGTQYKGMAKHMMKLDAFQKSIQSAVDIFRAKGLDLSNVLSTDDDETLNDVCNSAVSIVAIQIALVDTLKAVGVVPEMIVGHSLGEIAAAYTDSCLSAEQALAVTLIRSRAFRNSKPGAMASVGLSWDQALEQCPIDVFPACDNSADNVTISGNDKAINEFVLELQSKSIFAKGIQSSGMAYHSVYMNPCAEYMREHLPSILPDPKIRSSKWISTSVPEAESSSSLYLRCCVDYWINNALAPVRFREAIELMPPNALAVEIGPHCVLQAILKRALPSTVTKIGVMNKKATNNCNHFLEALGKLYLAGHNPNFGALYERVKYPLGPTTPMISPVIRWDHSQSWIVPIKKETLAGGSKYQVNPKTESDRFYLEHIIDGRALFPGLGYMYIVWTQFATRLGKSFENCSVTFEDVRFERGTIISPEVPTEFFVNIHLGSGAFEVQEGDSPVCRGKIQELEIGYKTIPVDWDETQALDQPSNTAEVFYNTAKLRGYGHQGVFRTLRKVDPSGEWAEIQWQDNWVGFIDHLLQLNCNFQRVGSLILPTRIQKAVFRPQALLAFMKEGNTVDIPARALKKFDIVMAPGFEIRGMRAAAFPRRQEVQVPRLSAYRHVPFVSLKEESLGLHESLTFCLDIAMDNTAGTSITVLEFANQGAEQDIICSMLNQGALVPKFENSELYLVSDNQEKEALQDISVVSTNELESLKAHLRPNLIIVSEKHMGLAEEYMDETSFLLCIQEKASELPTVILDCNNNETKLDIRNYTVVAQHPGMCLYRLKLNMDVKQQGQAIEVKPNSFDWVEAVKFELSHCNERSRLYLYSHSVISGLQGFIQCMRKEEYNQIRSFEALDNGFAIDFETPSRSLQAMMEVDLVYNVYHSGSWGCFTSLPLKEASTSLDSLSGSSSRSVAYMTQTGDLSSLKWLESPLEVVGPEREDSLVEVAYAALNFRDVMLATGKLSRDALSGEFPFEESILGIEYSGVLKDGTRVMGMLTGGCLATAVEPVDDLGLMWPVPQHWTLAEAATVPIAYGTAYYALVVKGKIREGETVLIHSGAGGVGQAAIAIALSRKCRVITTVSTMEKREYLMGQFPELTEASFANSRDPVAFEFHVMDITNGRGVDVVLNSLSQESFKASIRCLGSSGRFLEIGKFDLFNNTELGIAFFLKSIEFHGILLDYLKQPGLCKAAVEEKKMINALVLEGIDTGVVAPLPYTECDQSQLEEAFRLMASGKHMGKILIKIREHPQALPNIPALPRTYFYPHKVYILVGGLGGMGLQIANWMVNRGARNLVFVSRSGVRNWHQEFRVKAWEAKGANIQISTCDVTDADGAQSLLQMARDIGSIGGIFNLAVELRDALFINQTSETFQVVANPKIQATLLLDEFSQMLAPDLDYFVVFSSAVTLCGNAGQSSYGFANSAIERICMRRRAAGRHGLAIQWGPIGEVGIYHSQTGGQDLPAFGCNPQRVPSVLKVMDLLLKSSEAVISSFEPESKLNDKRNKLEGNSLAEVVARVLGIKDFSNVSPEATFEDLGMDSLIGTEIKQLLQTKLSISVPTTRIRSMTFAKLAELQVNQGTSEFVKKEEFSSPINPTTLVHSKSTLVKMESKRIKSSNLFLVHPVEGNVRMLEGLVKDLHCEVYGFECTPDAPLSSIPTLASHYIESMKTVQAQGPYWLAGFSYGGAVACEIAFQIERCGEIVDRLLLLDGSPEIPRMFSQTFSKNVNIEGDEAIWLSGFLAFHSTQNMVEVEAEMMTRSTWEHKLDYVANRLLSIYPAFTLNEIKELGVGFVRRMKAGCSYSPKGKVRCETTMIRAGKSGFDAIIGKDYGLSEICASKVKIIVVDGYHTCFCEEPTELSIAQIINAVLE